MRCLRPASFVPFLLLLALLRGEALVAQHGVILLYHHVATDTPPSTSISPADFRAHLEYLRDHDFNVIALDTLIESLRERRPVPERAVAITFDDGYISVYEQAFPMLQEFGFPFTLFLSTGPTDRGMANYLSWQQVQEMAAAGVLIANHMVEHPYMLERRPGEDEQAWLARLRDELLHAEARIEEHTGQSHRYLAYPYGEFDPSIKEMLATLDFVGLAQNSGAAGYNSDFLALPRFPLAGFYADLDTARTKFATKAFNVTLVSPASPITELGSPPVTLKFDPGDYELSRIGCFANSQPIPMRWVDPDNGVVELTPEQDFQGRRWRYICTAPDSRSSGYYWYSVQWIRLPAP